MLDVWEVAYVWAWPVADREQINTLEAFLFHQFHPQSSLMNGDIPPNPGKLRFPMPTRQVTQLLPNEEIESRKRIALRLPRQAKQFLDLLDHFLNVKDATELHLAMQAHLERLNRYFAGLRPTQSEGDSE